ncbi:uncharacterized protein ACNLHF_027291 isoform 1-T2 [Anomaloglossus baeobatrachus]
MKPDIGGLWESEISAIEENSTPAHNVAPKGKSSQSSTKGRYYYSRIAIDGQLSYSCTETKVEYEPWWTLDLMSSHIITFVAITNREYCCANALDGAEIHVGKNANWKENPSCGIVSSIGLGKTFSFNCGAVHGQFVTIVIPQKNTSLSLCEVQVFGLPHEFSQNVTERFKVPKNFIYGAPNVAPSGTASHSSSYESATPASRAIDGSLNNYHPSCTHTQYDQDPWWTVDLHSEMNIMSVAITNRGDCCGFRINRAEVRVGKTNGDGKSNPRCAIISTIAQGQTLAVNCHGMRGRYVSIVIEGRKECLTLCEVQVFGLPAEEEIRLPAEPLPSIDPTDKPTAAIIKEPKSLNAIPVAKITIKETSQSSTHKGSISGNAADGRLENKHPDSQCAVTKKEFEPWWTASLGSNYIIYSVAMTSRGDCCTSDLDGAVIHVGYNKTNWRSSPICGSINSIGLGKTNLFKCNLIGGEFVTISIPNRNTSLSLCEVQLFGVEIDRQIPYCVGNAENEQQKNNHGAPNVAPGGLASQSSHSKYPDKTANLAIDENLASNYYERSCFHTDGDRVPWWTVDLMSGMRVSSVVITNRGDCCSERIKGAEIRIGDSKERNNPRCAKISLLGFGDTFYFDCGGMEGRYVSVVIPGRKEYLHLCEVQVFAEPIEGQRKSTEPKTAEVQEVPMMSNAGKETTVSARKFPLFEVSQSSTKGKGLAKNAVDGFLTPRDPESRCAVTMEQYEPWWKVKLQQEYQIHSVAITSRKDCCSSHFNGAEIRIGRNDSDWRQHNICGTVSSMGLGETVSYNCNWMVGMFVTIVVPDRTASLALCEVQVFGQPSQNVATWNKDAETMKDSSGVPNVAPRGLIFQSSYYDKLRLANVVVDGNLATNYFLKSCTHTEYDQDPWWRIDMLSRIRVSSVAITNRGDCCARRLDGAEIRIGDSEILGGGNNPRCAKITVIGLGETFIFDCDGMEGRFVTIIIPGRKEHLQLCEVQVFAEILEEKKDEMYDNVALGGVASQSSTFSSAGEAQNANDGSLANNHIMSQCSITQREVSPWWIVDLKSSYKIMSVVITNRVLECCKDRISGAEIRIGNSSEMGGTMNPRCGVISSMESGESLYFACNGMVGQYVTVTIPGRAEHLILCEVQVFGLHDFSGGNILEMNQETPQGAPNLALSGRSLQSSIFNFFGDSKNAIDGSLSSDYSQMQCSQTVQEINPWWTVELRGIFSVLSVAVTNRQDLTWERLKNAEIRIGNSKDWIQNPRCAIIHSLGPGHTGLFNCKGMEGRYVTVLLPDKIESLSLCEVQVFGLPISSVGKMLRGTEGNGFVGGTLMFPEKGDWSYAILQPQAPIDLLEFTLCLRLFTARSEHREVILFSYFNDGKDELNVWRELDGQLSLYLRSSSEGAIFSVSNIRTFGTHVCMTWLSSSGVTRFWVNGKRSTSQIYRKGHYVSPGGTVILGQDQDTSGGSFEEKQSFVGEISDVHLWNYVLPASAIKDVYKNKQTTAGNIIDWNSVKYSLYGNVMIQ